MNKGLRVSSSLSQNQQNTAAPGHRHTDMAPGAGQPAAASLNWLARCACGPALSMLPGVLPYSGSLRALPLASMHNHSKNIASMPPVRPPPDAGEKLHPCLHNLCNCQQITGTQHASYALSFHQVSLQPPKSSQPTTSQAFSPPPAQPSHLQGERALQT